MKKTTTKRMLFDISRGIVMLLGFIAGLIAFMFLTLPFLKSLGPNPNRFIVIFVVLPMMLLVAAIFSFLGIGFYMLIWKPFLNAQEIDTYIFKEIIFRHGIIIDKKDITKVKKLFFKQPSYIFKAILLGIVFVFDRAYYKMITFIFPQNRK